MRHVLAAGALLLFVQASRAQETPAAAPDTAAAPSTTQEPAATPEPAFTDGDIAWFKSKIVPSEKVYSPNYCERTFGQAMDVERGARGEECTVRGGGNVPPEAKAAFERLSEENKRLPPSRQKRDYELWKEALAPQLGSMCKGLKVQSEVRGDRVNVMCTAEIPEGRLCGPGEAVEPGERARCYRSSCPEGFSALADAFRNPQVPGCVKCAAGEVDVKESLAAAKLDPHDAWALKDHHGYVLCRVDRSPRPAKADKSRRPAKKKS